MKRSDYNLFSIYMFYIIIYFLIIMGVKGLLTLVLGINEGSIIYLEPLSIFALGIGALYYFKQKYLVLLCAVTLLASEFCFMAGLAELDIALSVWHLILLYKLAALNNQYHIEA